MIYAVKDNRNVTANKLTKTKLCPTCIDESCKWYVRAFIKPKRNGLWTVTSHMGSHNHIPFGLQRDNRMMDSEKGEIDVDSLILLNQSRAMVPLAHDQGDGRRWGACAEEDG